jgi:endonuclease/exonuclease/phosphatase family metal-dependent hydrolase
MRFRAATFNMRHGRGLDGVIDLERTAATVRAASPDLVALQEVDRGLRRSGRVDQPRALGELTGMEVSFWPTLARAGGHYGIALAARGGLEARYEPLPRATDEEEPRGAIVARWRGMTVVATHLSLKRESRATQIEAVAELAASGPQPALVMGDLNQSSAALEPLLERGFHGGNDRHPTLRSWRIRHIDHVLAGPGLTVARTWIVDLEASDHRLLAAEIERA